jgi:hypothetical protein
VGTFFDLLVREVAMLVMLGALGSGFASVLRPDPAWGSRLALAPVFGLAVATFVTTTTLALFPIGTGAWAVVVPLAVASVVVAVVRLRPLRPRLTRGLAVQVGALVALALVVSSAFNVPLAERDTLGPIAYRAYDAPGYGVQSYEYSKNTIGDLEPFAKFDHGPDLTKRYAAYQVALNQQIGFDTVGSTANVVFGFRHMSTQSAFVIALLVVGAFGAFAAVRSFTDRRVFWPALLSGALFAGPFFFQLFMDGSQAAIAGLALLAPVCLGGYRALRTRSLLDVVLFGVLAAGLQTTYPYFVPPVAGAAVIVLVVWLIRALRRGDAARWRWGRIGVLLGLVIVVALALSPIATARTVTYWHDLLKTNFAISASLPKFNLPFLDLFSYLFQTREFYFLPNALHSGLGQFGAGILAPLGLLGVVGVGLWRYRWALVLLPVVVLSGLLGAYYMNRYDCSYCLQRSLLPIAPLALVAVGIGLVALWTWGPVWLRGLAVGAGLATLLVVGHLSTVEARRIVDGASVNSHYLTDLLPAVRNARGGPIYFEAPGQTYFAPLDEPVIYHTVNEVSPEQMALSTEADDYSGLAFLGGVHPTGREFTPAYRWIVTRVPSVRNGDRTVVTRKGPFALERRTGPFDIAVINGVTVADPRDDPNGDAWVTGPMTYWVTSSVPRPVWARLTYAGPAARQATLAAPPNGRVIGRTAGSVTFCVPVTTTAPLRRLTVNVGFPQAPAMSSGRQFDEKLLPPHALRLAAMSTTTRECTR